MLLTIAARNGSRPGPPRVEKHPAVPARDFADSVGVNVHLSYMDTAYRDLAAVRRALAQLGVRHVRDGACAGCTESHARMRELGRDGVRFTLIAGSPRNETGTLEDNLASIRTRLAGVVEAVEGPNEYDASGDPDWAAALRAYQRELFAQVRGDPALRRLDVVGPSFVRAASREEAGDLSAWMTLGNLHSYPSGEEPDRGLDGELALAARVSGDRPVVATETGYTTARAPSDGRDAVPEAVAGRYVPRLYLEYFRRGIRRTFLYELVDEKPDPEGADAEQHFGLLRADFTPKPAFSALRGLLRAVGDGAPAGGDAELAYAVEGGGDARRLLFARAGGGLSLVLWREPVPDGVERVTVRLRRSVAGAAVMRGGAVVARHYDTAAIPVDLGTDPVVVRLDGTGG